MGNNEFDEKNCISKMELKTSAIVEKRASENIWSNERPLPGNNENKLSETMGKDKLTKHSPVECLVANALLSEQGPHINLKRKLKSSARDQGTTADNLG